jgi:hypothetical protein
MLLAAMAVSCSAPDSGRTNFMWIDSDANYAWTSSEDSIKANLRKIKDAGCNAVVVDVKPLMGEVLYDSRIAPYFGEFHGVTRERSYDMLGLFIEHGHELGMKVYASMNVFCGGNLFMKRGIIYGEHSDWQSQVLLEDGEIHPISEMGGNYNGMLNPVDPEVQEYELSIIRELAGNYLSLDGLVLDRMRFDSQRADFSELSRRTFESWLGREVENFPDDILSADLEKGPLFGDWITWRASVIKQFLAKVRRTVKEVNPDLRLCDYTGSWYPTYYSEGLNWASDRWKPSEYFDWAPESYDTTGYAQLLDDYMTGLYYETVTKAEVDSNLRALDKGASEVIEGVHESVEMKYARDYWYCVEGGAEWAEKVTMGAVPVYGSILISQYKDDDARLESAVRQAGKSTEGVMLFDYSHIRTASRWEAIRSALKDPENSSGKGR